MILMKLFVIGVLNMNNVLKAWSDSVKLRNLTIGGLRSEIRTRDLAGKKQEHA
jgi:hypothetical protein